MCDLWLSCLLVCIHCVFSFPLILSLSPSPLFCLPLLFVPHLMQTGRIMFHSWTNTSETNLYPFDSELSIPVSLQPRVGTMIKHCVRKLIEHDIIYTVGMTSQCSWTGNNSTSPLLWIWLVISRLIASGYSVIVCGYVY